MAGASRAGGGTVPPALPNNTAYCDCEDNPLYGYGIPIGPYFGCIHHEEKN